MKKWFRRFIKRLREPDARFEWMVDKDKEKSSAKMVMFQGRMVLKEYRDAYMNGYHNPRGVHPGGKWASVYAEGQLARRRDDLMEGTF